MKLTCEISFYNPKEETRAELNKFYRFITNSHYGKWPKEKEKNMTFRTYSDYVNYKDYYLEKRIQEFKARLENMADQFNLKVFTEELPRRNWVDVYFIDPFNLQKTLFMRAYIDDLEDDWENGVLSRLEDRFGEPEVVEYCKVDVEATKKIYRHMLNSLYGAPKTTYVSHRVPKIKEVCFNGPATIIFWSDDTKTVVKTQDEDFDPEKGMAMAIAKKALGNNGKYYNTFKKWLPEEEEPIEFEFDGKAFMDDILKAFKGENK